MRYLALATDYDGTLASHAGGVLLPELAVLLALRRPEAVGLAAAHAGSSRVAGHA